jgi:hypothetical protein
MKNLILSIAGLVGMIGWGLAYFVFFRKIAKVNAVISALLAAIAFSITAWLLFIPMADWDFAVSRKNSSHNISLFYFLSATECLFPWFALCFLYQYKKSESL